MRKNYLWHRCEITTGRKPIRPDSSQDRRFISRSAHVKTLAITNTDDSVIWEYAKVNNFAIVSKDADFHQRSLLYGHPPKFINLSTFALGTVQRPRLCKY